MGLVEEFEQWYESVGTPDEDQGHNESVEWVLNTFGEDGAAELADLIQAIGQKALITAMSEGEPLNIAIAITYTALRFGIDLEAKKHLPSL